MLHFYGERTSSLALHSYIYTSMRSQLWSKDELLFANRLSYRYIYRTSNGKEGEELSQVSQVDFSQIV